MAVVLIANKLAIIVITVCLIILHYKFSAKVIAKSINSDTCITVKNTSITVSEQIPV